MERFAGVQEKSWSAGAGEGGGDFSSDQAGFAEACDDYSSFAGVQKFDGFFETGVEAFDQAGDGFGFDAQDALGGFEAHWGWASHSRVRADEVVDFLQQRAKFFERQSIRAVGESLRRDCRELRGTCRLRRRLLRRAPAAR